jgi:hypothetical protein
MFSETTGVAALPTVLLDSTVETALAVAAGRTAASVAPVQVAALAEGVIQAMFLTKLKIVTVTLLFALAGLGTVVGVAQVTAAGPRPRKAPVTQLVAAPAEAPAKATDGALQQQLQGWTWYLANVDEAQSLVSLQTQPHIAVAVRATNIANGGFAGGEGGGKVIVKTLPAGNPEADAAKLRLLQEAGAANVRFRTLDGGVSFKYAGPSGILMQVGVAENVQVVIDGLAAGLGDLQRGMQVNVQMANGQPVITRIDAITPGKVTVTAIDADKRVITVSLGGQDWTAAVAGDATITVPGNEQAQLSDLSPGMRVGVTMGVDGGRIVVKSLLANGE